MKGKDKTKEQLLSEIENLQRRIAELEARETEQRRYKDLVDFLPQAVFETDNTGNITFANRVVLEVTGYTPDDIEKGMSGLQLMIPEERDRFGEFMSRVARGEEHSSIEITALRKDGSTFPAIMFPSPIMDGEKPVGVRGVVVDITGQKQMEEKLKVFSNAVEGAIDAIAITDMKGIISYVNPSMETIYGYKKGEMLGKSVLNLSSNPEIANEIMSAMLTCM